MMIINLFLLSIIIAFCSSVCGFVYIRILQQPEHLLGGWHKWLTKVFKNDERYVQGKDDHWLYTILGGCEVCNSGQIALWSFTWIAIQSGLYSLPLTEQIVTTLMFHVFTICAAIISVITVKHLYDKCVN